MDEETKREINELKNEVKELRHLIEYLYAELDDLVKVYESLRVDFERDGEVRVKRLDRDERILFEIYNALGVRAGASTILKAIVRKLRELERKCSKS